jgi:hypothetical protein
MSENPFPRNPDELIISLGGCRPELRCPFSGCDSPEYTHVVDVKWEKDPDEGDRKYVRMEVRCENGHGFVLCIKNHAGNSFLQWDALLDNRSPFGEDRTW